MNPKLDDLLGKKGPMALIILDGFGFRAQKEGNAIAQAAMPVFRKILEDYPSTYLRAAGEDVGLPTGFMGNSEVGHRAIGAGRVVPTVLKRFHEAIDDGSFFKHKELTHAFLSLIKADKVLHLVGLLSDAGVHSHEKHLYALLEAAQKVGCKKIVVHPVLDGRDTPPTSAARYLERLEAFCLKNLSVRIGSIHGRFYAMDRDKNWKRTQRSYDVLCNAQTGEIRTNTSWQQVLEESYKAGQTDEFVEPTRLRSTSYIRPGDGLLFFNIRADRMRQLGQSFVDPSFDAFTTNNLAIAAKTLSFVITATTYDSSWDKTGVVTLFDKKPIKNTLIDEIVHQKKFKKRGELFVIAETEKYAHVTYFLHGEREEPLDCEERVLIPSRKARDYINHPEMSALSITKTVLESLKKNPASLYVINYANADMVGHSGNLSAAIQACELLDEQLKVLFEEIVEKQNGVLVITADHGNAEEMIDEQGYRMTSHTSNMVPFVLSSSRTRQGWNIKSPGECGLIHVAPTILTYLGLSIPQQMSQEVIMVPRSTPHS